MYQDRSREVDQPERPRDVGWRRLGASRPVPPGVRIYDHDGEILRGRAATRAWRESCRAAPPPAPQAHRHLVPALPDDQLRAWGWREVVAPRWHASEEEIAAWLGPAATEADAELAFEGWDDDEWPARTGVDLGGDRVGMGATPAAEAGGADHGSDSAVVLGLRADPHPQERGWPLAEPGQRLPVGLGRCRDGDLVDVGAHARRRADDQVLRDLLTLDIAATDPYTVVEALAAWNRVEALAAYHKRKLAHELAKRPQVSSGCHRLDAAARQSAPVAADEISFRLGITRQAALRLVDAGAAMDNGTAVLTGTALEHGEIDARKADLLIERTDHLPAELAFEAQCAVLDAAPMRTVPQLQRDLARVIADPDPEDFATRHARACQHRRVGAPRALPDGMAATSIIWPATDAMAMHTALEAAARTALQAGDQRTLDHLRCDALATMAHTALATGQIGPCQQHHDVGEHPGSTHPHSSDVDHDDQDPGDIPPDTTPPDTTPRGTTPHGTTPHGTPVCAAPSEVLAPWRLGAVGGARAQIRITVPLSTLMGTGAEPADLEGYGPIPAEVARAWAAGGEWRRLVTDPLTKRPIEATPRRYKPPRGCANKSWHVTSRVSRRPATPKPATPTSTTASPSHKDPPRPGTCTPSADITTASKRRRRSATPHPNPECTSGPRLPATSTAQRPE